jgi:hypothetical protein
MTKTFDTAGILNGAAVGSLVLAAKLGDELGPLPLGKPADRLRGRDPALVEDAIGLHPAVLRYSEQHVEDLRGRNIFGGSRSSE